MKKKIKAQVLMRKKSTGFSWHHLEITKKVKSGITFSSITKLDQEQRTIEIGRMLGGNVKTSQAHAKEMLAVE